jgi:hypothetical protein
MRGAPATRVLLATDQAAAGNVGQGRRLAVAESNVEVLATPRLGPAQQGSHDAVACVQASRQIRDGHADLDGWAVTGAGDVHQAKLGLDHDVVPSANRIWPSLAVARDGRIDERWVDGPEGLVVERVLFERTWEVVFDENVALCHQLVQDLDAFGVLK